jgi:hypothetical protein
MSDVEAAGASAAPTDSFLSDYLVKEAARSRLAEQLRPVNKTVLFDALAAAAIVAVVVRFDGYGDSGQIESVEGRDALGEAALPEVEIELASPTYDGQDVGRRTLPLAAAIEELAYDLLEETHAGWENNDGAYGDFVFDVAERTITLDHNSRYTAVDSYTHAF